MTPPKTLEERDAAPAIVLARVRLHNMERSHIWRAGARNLPDGMRLNMSMSRPFMNFKEAREQLAELLSMDPLKVKFESHRGSRTFYPTSEDLLKLAVADTVEV